MRWRSAGSSTYRQAARRELGRSGQAPLASGGQRALRPLHRGAGPPRARSGRELGARRGRLGPGRAGTTWRPGSRASTRSATAPACRWPRQGSSPRPRPGSWPRTSPRGLRGGERPQPYEGAGSCYLEFGGGLVAKVEANFLGGPAPTAQLVGPSLELAAEKEEFAATRGRAGSAPSSGIPGARRVGARALGQEAVASIASMFLVTTSNVRPSSSVGLNSTTSVPA